ncbi:MAG: formate dehydrogenase accessory sulfurtransferase FdhD [Gammaproteobacteria bacterium]|jgi:FdhD protein|nr:formate dehydrogenase accessory sulfurtransferase FdhD [Gammaproteobacteria bacterium]
MKIADLSSYLLYPQPDAPGLTDSVVGRDQNNQPVKVDVVTERGLTVYLNRQEIVTLMTLGDHPEYLALGFLLNQNMLRPDDVVTGIDYDEELEVVIVRTQRETNYEDKLKKKVRTSGCAQGTVFGDVMEKFSAIELAQNAHITTSAIYTLSKQINTTPSIYHKAGAIHGCVLCLGDKPLVYMEDVGRHNAIDKIAGYMYQHDIAPQDKCFYTTGRLTSEMVIKTVQMRIPILISRSGFTAWGVDLARQAGLTLVGRAKGRSFVALSGYQRLHYDTQMVQD